MIAPGEYTCTRCGYGGLLYEPHSTRQELVAALREAIDSLEYIDRAHPGITGVAVRIERIAKLRALSDRLQSPEGT